jgi:hypothetical protein
MINKEIIFLVDYNNRFSSKWAAIPYRSGMDKLLLKNEFEKLNVSISFMPYYEIDFRNQSFFDNKVFLYTSSEDENLFYKSYIEDIILGLEIIGAEIIPGYKYLRAHHNKTFMEILRDISKFENKDIKSSYFGSYEDFKVNEEKLKYPLVLKSAFGATGKTVTLISSKKEALKKTKRFSSSKSLFYDFRDFVRNLRHKGYVMESRYRKKFIVQNFIAGMDRDYKILVFGNKFYVLERKVKKNDFRASGSGLIGYTKKLPDGLLDYAKQFFEYQDLPFFAMDVAFNGSGFTLIEFQALYFGSHTLDTAPYYFVKQDENWKCIEGESILEKEVATSVVAYLKKGK